MSGQVASVEKATECVACGGILGGQRYGRYQDFCSEACKKAGRVACKFCNAPLPMGKGFTFCDNNNLCKARFHRIGALTPTIIQELNRSECLVCGEYITQPAVGRKRRFCRPEHNRMYHSTKRIKRDLQEDWGGYASETSKCLREVQQFMGISAARHLATAIDREYILRSRLRLRRGNLNNTKLTWEQVDEIRVLLAEGHISHRAIASRFGVSPGAIGRIFRGETWTPENDPRTKTGIR